MRPQSRLTFPRSLHPGAWWLWAIGLAAAASRTQNPVPLLLILVVAGLVVSARRSTAPWAKSYGAFLKLALLIIAIRIVFQVLLSTASQGPTVLFTLPSIPMPESSGLKLGGQVTLEALLRAFYEGLQLGVILCCVGAANALGSARRLLRYVPGALYEVGVACVIALTFAPQLVTDAQRVREAHRLRGRSTRGPGSLKRLAMPVLEGALEHSVELAAAMDSRGYGRTTDDSRGLPPTDRACSCSAACWACAWGSTASSTAPRPPGWVCRCCRSGACWPLPASRSEGGVPGGPAIARTRGRCPSGWSPAVVPRPRWRSGSTSRSHPSSSTWPASPWCRRCRWWPPVGILVALLPAVLAPPQPVAHSAPTVSAGRTPRGGGRVITLRTRRRQVRRRHRPGARRRRPHHPRGRAGSRGRSHRVGQDDPAPRDQRPGAALLRRHPERPGGGRRPRHPRRTGRATSPTSWGTSGRTRWPASSPTRSRTSSPTAWSRWGCRPT